MTAEMGIENERETGKKQQITVWLVLCYIQQLLFLVLKLVSASRTFLPLSESLIFTSRSRRQGRDRQKNNRRDEGNWERRGRRDRGDRDWSGDRDRRRDRRSSRDRNGRDRSPKDDNMDMVIVI